LRLVFFPQIITRSSLESTETRFRAATGEAGIGLPNQSALQPEAEYEAIIPSILLRASSRDRFTPVSHDDDVGFRLARHRK
jgi:hypothetical protein